MGQFSAFVDRTARPPEIPTLPSHSREAQTAHIRSPFPLARDEIFSAFERTLVGSRLESQEGEVRVVTSPFQSPAVPSRKEPIFAVAFEKDRLPRQCAWGWPVLAEASWESLMGRLEKSHIDPPLSSSGPAALEKREVRLPHSGGGQESFFRVLGSMSALERILGSG